MSLYLVWNKIQVVHVGTATEQDTYTRARESIITLVGSFMPQIKLEKHAFTQAM